MSLATLLKEEAFRLGFDAVGIAPARALSEQTERFHSYLEKGANGKMTYLERNKDKRLDPQILMPNSKSVVVVLMNYGSSVLSIPVEQRKNGISLYAQGEDYHTVLKSRLFALQNFFRVQCPESYSRCFVDTAPIMEKIWAVEAGLGWQGRHSLLLHPDFGSFCFIGILLCTEVMDYDSPLNIGSPCVNCDAPCLTHCPTHALQKEGYVDARKCLSYLTIEHPECQAEHILPKDVLSYGCDTCQLHCLHNRHCIQSGSLFKAKIHQEFLSQ